MATWRLQGDRLVRVNEGDNLEVTVCEAIMEADEPQRNKERKDRNNKNSLMIKGSIKNKAGMQRILASLTMPSDFVKFLITCLTITVISIAMIVAMYVIFIQLFDKLMQEIQMIFYQMDICRAVMTASSLTLQLVSVNE